MVVLAKEKYYLVLAESSIEIVPKTLWKHPSVIKTAKRRGKKPSEIILDVSLHYHAMKGLPMRKKRGRPDIVHLSLLLALNSPLNKAGLLETYVHTLNDYVIFVRKDVRIPKNYNRFIGLMEQLFSFGKVPPESETPLLYVKNMSLSGLLESIEPRKAILLSEKGDKISLSRLANVVKKGDAIIIGGFAHGDFLKETYELADEVYSIYGEALETWTVLSRMLCVLEMQNGLI